jgi:hypothetical protein
VPKNQQGQKPKKQKKGNRPAFEAGPLTRREFKREAKAASRLAFQPEKRELAAESRAEKVGRKRMRGYFQAYGQAVKSANTETSAAYNDALSKITAQGNAAALVDDSLRQSIESEAARDAASRGATYTPSAQAASAIANRRAGSATIGSLTAGQGARQSAYLIDKKRIGEGERVNQLLRSKARSRSLNADKRALAKSKRDFLTDYESRARDTEYQKSLDAQQLASTRRGQKSQLAVAKQYGANQAAHDTTSGATQLKLQRRQAKAKKREQKRSQNIVNSQQKGSKGSDKGSGKTVSAASIVSYVADNAKPSQVASNPSVAINKVLSRWPYLDHSYVQKVVMRWVGKHAAQAVGGNL